MSFKGDALNTVRGIGNRRCRKLLPIRIALLQEGLAAASLSCAREAVLRYRFFIFLRADHSPGNVGSVSLFLLPHQWFQPFPLLHWFRFIVCLVFLSHYPDRLFLAGICLVLCIGTF